MLVFFGQAAVILLPLAALKLTFLEAFNLSFVDSSGSTCVAPLTAEGKHILSLFVVVMLFVALLLIFGLHSFLAKFGAKKPIVAPYIRCSCALFIFASMRLLTDTVRLFDCVNVAGQRVVRFLLSFVWRFFSSF